MRASLREIQSKLCSRPLPGLSAAGLLTQNRFLRLQIVAAVSRTRRAGDGLETQPASPQARAKVLTRFALCRRFPDKGKVDWALRRPPKLGLRESHLHRPVSADD